MLMSEPTSEMLEQWKKDFEEYKDKLTVNRKSASEVIEYLLTNYPVKEVTNEHWEKLIIEDINANSFSIEKIPEGAQLSAKVFEILNQGNGTYLYENQDSIFEGCTIYVGIELCSAIVHIEGSSLLHDELFVYQGLDAYDIKNPFLVSEYVNLSKASTILP